MKRAVSLALCLIMILGTVSFALAGETPTIDAIKASGKLTMATGTYVPFEYRDPDTDEIVGFDVDFGRYIADKLGVTLEVKDMIFSAIAPSIEDGKYDIAISAMYITDARKEIMLVSDSYLATGMVLVALTNSDKAITSLADCDGLRVAVKAGATSDKVAATFLEENPGVNYEIVGYEDTPCCIADLVYGRVDVVMNDYLNQMQFNKMHDTIQIVCDPFTSANLGVFCQLGKDDLIAFINQCITDYEADGTKDTLFAKWIE